MMQQGIMSKLDALRQNMGQGQGQPQPAPAGPPPMAGPAPMGPAPMAPELMQDQAPEMVAEQPEQVDAGEDAQKLASAVLQRSQGNPQLALDIIEGAKGVVMQAIQGSERPQMMSMGGATGGDSSESDMSELYPFSADVVDVAMGPLYPDAVKDKIHRMITGRNVPARTFTDRDLKIAKMLAEANAQSGRSISDKDIEFYLQMLPKMESGGPLSQKNDKLRPVPEGNKGLAKLPEEVRNNMGFMAEGGGVSEALDRLNYLRGIS